jgi:hypothetical protein
MLTSIASLWGLSKGWRTLAASLAVAAAGVLQTADWATIVGPGKEGPALIGIGVIGALLRTITTTPVGKKSATS